MTPAARATDARSGLRRLAALLRSDKGPLIARWLQRVLADPTVPEARRLPMPTLQNHIPDLIDRLAESLERPSSPGPRAEPTGRSVGHADAAVAHAQERFAQGYTTEAALRELSHFRAALLDLCRAEDIELTHDAAVLVHSAVDEAMALAAIAIERADRAALEAGAERLRLATEAAAIGTWDWDLAIDTLTWDARTREIFGVAPDADVTYRGTFVAATHPEDRATVEKRVRRALDPASGGRYQAEHRIVSLSDGAERWVASRAHAYFDEGGRPLRLVGTIRDITDARRSEDALRVLSQAGAVLSSSLDYESTLKAVAELTVARLADYCIVDTVDAAGHFRRLELAARDPASRELLQRAMPFAPSLTPGSPFRQVVETRTALLVPRVTPAWLDALADAPPYRETLRALAPHSAMLVPFVARGRVLGVLKLLAAGSSRPYDARDLELAEDLARRAAAAVDHARLYQEAREAVSLLERVLGIVGHDLRTPLAAITFSAAALRERADAPPREARALERIAGSAARMDRMIADLLDVTRVRHGAGIPLVRRPTDLGRVCEQVVDEVRAARPARRVDLTVDGACRGDWDPDRVAQVVSNLLVNALDYSPPDTPVRVRVGPGGADFVTLEVHNEGEPIPPALAATLFEPFKRAASSRAGGLGLGLFIAREIVRAHGGTIEVHSAEGAGTRFVVRLPCGPAGGTGG